MPNLIQTSFHEALLAGNVSTLRNNGATELLGGLVNLAALEEKVARYIYKYFPASDLTCIFDGASSSYEISLNGQVLVSLDPLGMSIRFPTNRPERRSWSGFKEGGPENLAQGVIRELANAGFTVFDTKGNKLIKNRVHVLKSTGCPNCKLTGKIRIIVYSLEDQGLDLDRHVSGGYGAGFNDAEVRCIDCGWDGKTEDLRFTSLLKS